MGILTDPEHPKWVSAAPDAALAAGAPLFLELMANGRGRLDPLDATLMAAIVQANVAPWLGDAGAQQRWGALEDTPPDGMRRPARLLGLSRSLQIPLETVRRRVEGLAREGYCVATPDGVISPQRYLDSPPHRAAIAGALAAVRRMLRSLEGTGFAAPGAAAALAQADLPPRAVTRFAAEHFLRLVGPVSALGGDLVGGLVLLETLRASGDPRPVRVAGLARNLALPHETARRRVARMEAVGELRRGARGIEVAPALLAGPRFAALAEAHQASLHRLLAALASLEAGRGGLPVAP